MLVKFIEFDVRAECAYVGKTVWTYSLTITFDIVTVGWTFCLIDVWKNADTRLIHAHQILSAWRPIMYQTVLSILGCYGRSAGCSTTKNTWKLSTHFDRSAITANIRRHLPALIFDPFDWYDCFGIHYVDSIDLMRLPIAVFALQWATLCISDGTQFELIRTNWMKKKRDSSI